VEQILRADAWETSDDGEHWHKDFDLTYTRISGTPGHERNDTS